MKNLIKTLSVSLSIAMLLFVFLLAGCSRGPNEKELAMLDEARSAAMASQEKQSDCESEKANLESELAQKKQKLEEMKKEQKVVTQRLAEFGN
jgi:hypothetical protein